MTVEQAAQEILRHAGTRYDPKIVEAFKKALPTMRKVHAAISDQLGDIINLDFSRAGGKAAAAAQARKKAPDPVAAKK
jgi:HD-GYP domain-containing protein (c-di-GMP phosphodiesterase class II)